MKVNHGSALALLGLMGLLGGCVSASSTQTEADCRRASADNKECDQAKAAEGAAATPVTPH